MALPTTTTLLSSRSPSLPTYALPCQSKHQRPTLTRKRTQTPYGHPKPPALPYPKSSPTPLLLPPSHPPTLDRVLFDLESSPHLISPSLLSSFLSALPHHPAPRRLLSRLRRLLPVSLLRRHPSLAAKLLHLHTSLGLLAYAHHLFDLLPPRCKDTPFPWNCLIAGYADLGRHEDALALYFQMDEEGVTPDRFTFPRALKACAGIGSVAVGEAIHRDAVRAGFASDVFFCNALVDMYAKCGDIGRARRVFDAIPDRDVISWNAMLTGYLRHGLWPQALEVWRGMVRNGHEPDTVAVSAMLSGLSLHCDNGKGGTEIHAWVIRQGFDGELSVANSLIGMYSKNDELGCAVSVFESMPVRDLVSWNAIISAHSRDYRVLMLFRRMVDSGVQPDEVTFVSLLSACANLGMVEDGERLFLGMEKKYGILPSMEHYGCMVNMLAKAGMVNEAYEFISRRMPLDAGPTVWGALLFACSVQGNVEIGEIAAERLFELEPDNDHNFVLLMRIYRSAGKLEEVEKVRKTMKDRGL